MTRNKGWNVKHLTQDETTQLYHALYAVWNAIGPDVMDIPRFGDEGPMTNEDVVDICIDANHVATFSSKEDEALLDQCINQYGLINVVSDLNRIINFV